MAREFFCVYHSYRRSLQSLSDAEIGRLIRALLEYSEHGTAPDLPGKERIAFDFIAANIDGDVENYDAKITARRKNGKKGGRPPKGGEETQKPQKPNGFFENPKNHLVFTEKEENEENEKEEEKEERSKEEKEEEKEKEEKEEKDATRAAAPPTADGFAAFWDAYPRKANKAKAIDVWRQLKPSKKLQAEILRAVKAWSDSDQWAKDRGRYIPHPATWLNGRRWEDELPTSAKRKATDPAVSSLDTAEMDRLILSFTPKIEGGRR